MNRRALERTLDSLTRAELRTLARELTDWLGADAVARLVPDGPFERSSDAPQLQLAAVDVGAAAARLAHVRHAALAAIRADGSDLAPLRTALSTSVVLDAIAEGLRRATSDAIRAVGFDFRAGMELIDELFDTLVRMHVAVGQFDARWTPPRPQLDELLAAIRTRIDAVAIDETVFRMLVEVCREASLVASESAPWSLVEAAASNGRNPAAFKWIERALERGPAPDAVVPLLAAMAQSVGQEDADGFIQAAEMHLDAGEQVFELMIRVLHGRERIHEARFWIGEGRLRHPDALAWARLEESLF